MIDQDKIDELLKIIGIGQYQAFQQQKEIELLRNLLNERDKLIEELNKSGIVLSRPKDSKPENCE